MSRERKFLMPFSENWESIETEKNKKNKETLNQQLLSAMQMQNIMVLAGSGTSLDIAGGPSMATLWNNCMKEENRYSEEAKKIMVKVRYEDVSEEIKNIEEFLSRCEASCQLENDIEVSNFINKCKEIILKKCSFPKTSEQLDGHKRFIHRLSRRRIRDSRLKLFTTNYDTCFEEAANNQGIVVIDGFSFARPRQYDPRYFDFDIVRRSSNSNTTDNYLEGVFQLFKLHGSVTWQKESDASIFEKEATPEGACMIFPAKGKYQQSYIQPHLELMARYLAALREPNTCLIVTGFGFNDDHLSAPIISAIHTNPSLRVIIADYNAEKNTNENNQKVSSCWQKLKTLSGEGENLLFINASFQEFSKLIPDLQALTPAEQMARAVKNVIREDQ